MENLNLSPINLFVQAGPVGKTVIVLLGIASVWCWFHIFDGWLALLRLGRSLRRARSKHTGGLLDTVIEAGATAQRERFFDEGTGEVRQRMIETMNREARRIISRLESGLPNLAVIASVTPFIGLFGTVWGIMSSFTAIADANDTSLAVVAPGIAEALATTAFGLAAAIPASIAYSRLGSSFAAKAQEVDGFVEEMALAQLREPKA